VPRPTLASMRWAVAVLILATAIPAFAQPAPDDQPPPPSEPPPPSDPPPSEPPPTEPQPLPEPPPSQQPEQSVEPASVPRPCEPGASLYGEVAFMAGGSSSPNSEQHPTLMSHRVALGLRLEKCAVGRLQFGGVGEISLPVLGEEEVYAGGGLEASYTRITGCLGVGPRVAVLRTTGSGFAFEAGVRAVFAPRLVVGLDGVLLTSHEGTGFGAMLVLGLGGRGGRAIAIVEGVIAGVVGLALVGSKGPGH